MLILQRGVYGQRVDAVVFDGVGIAHDLYMFQPRHGAVHGQLHVVRQRRAHALHVHLVRARAFGFQKDLVPFLVGKAHHLVFDGRAVARSRALDDARIQRRAVQVGADDGVRLFVGIGQIAGRLRLRHPLRQVRKGIDARVAVLPLAFRVVDGAPVHAGGGARLEPPHRKAEVDKVLRQRRGGGEAVGAGALLPFAGDDGAVQVHARGEHGGLGGDDLAVGGAHAAHLPVSGEDLRRLALADGQVGRVFQRLFHAGVVGVLVRLRAQALHRRPLAHVEHAHLQRRLVGIDAHLPAQRVYLAHQVPLGGAADGGVAGHEGDAV